ncbi:MAG TPA: hypothetical protein VGK10_00320 [Prolixibacteraceae bacterium]|jgi:hypothetical protein
MKKGTLVNVIFIVSLLACNKSKENLPADSKIYFKGITKMDDMGYSLSSPDTTDWRFDDKWTAKEEALFTTTTFNTPTIKYSTRIILYPNPFQSIFRINLNNMPDSSYLAIRLVDKDFNIILKKDSIVLSINLCPQVISGNDTMLISGYDTLRLYYKMIDHLNYEFKGHGDILIK